MGIFNKLLGDSKAPEPRFWEWFAEHSDELMAVATAREKICDALVRQMRKVDRGLMFAFGPTRDGRREFVVSADGIRSVFPAVQKLVAAAPDLPGWKIIAFRPAADLDSITFGDRKMGKDDIWFHAYSSQGAAAVDLYIRDYTEATAQPLTQAAFLLLDYALGEYDVETKLGALSFKPLPIDPVAEGLKPFRELPETVRQLTSTEAT
jgi:hypothetical protein